jgi:hypothetical protein
VDAGVFSGGNRLRLRREKQLLTAKTRVVGRAGLEPATKGLRVSPTRLFAVCGI